MKQDTANKLIQQANKSLMNKIYINDIKVLVRKLKIRARQLRKMGIEESSRWNNVVASNYEKEAKNLKELAQCLNK
jgi:hypothetical protein